MKRSIVSRFAPIALLALAGLGGYACSDSTGPGGGRTVALSVRPTFEVEGAASVVSLTRARVVVHRTGGAVALDTLITLPAGGRSATSQVGADRLASITGPIDLQVTVPIAGSAPSTGEDFTVNFELLDGTGNVLFTGGPASVHGDPSSPPGPLSLAADYVGTGSAADRVVVTPTTANVAPGGAVDVTARALTASGTEIPGTPVMWSSLDPTIASVPNPAVGRAVAGAVRGTARIRATLLTGQNADATITVRPLASAIALQSGNGQAGTVGSAAAAPLVVKVTATDGQGIDGVVVTFAIQSGGGVLSSTQVTTALDGTASVGYTFGQTAGAVTVTATAAGLTGSPVSFVLTGNASTPSQLAFTTQPANGFVGSPFAAVVVEARDQFGNRMTGFTGTVTLGLVAPPSSLAQLQGTLSVAAVAGVATFSNISVSAAANSLQLLASAIGVPNNATSATFAVTVRPAAALVFTAQPSGTVPAGDVMTDIVVQARDAVGGLVTNYSGVVTLAIDNPPAGVTLQGTTAVTAVNGVATFGGVSVSAQAASIRLVASGSGITGSFFSTNFVVGPPSNAFVATPPATTFTVQRTAPSPAPVVVAITASSVQVTAMTLGGITYGPGATGWLGATLSATSTPSNLTLTATTGTLPEGTFTANVTINGSAGASTIYPVTVTITPLPVTQLAMITNPAGAASGAPFVTQPVVELRDATGTRVLSATNIVTAAIGSGPGTIAGTLVRAAVQGRATFTDLRINGTGAHQIAFTAAGVPAIAPITSAAFTVGAALTTTQAVPATIGDAGTLIPSFTPVTAAGGIAPYSFVLTGGALPGGMNFNTTNGLVSGTPATTLATTTFTVTVTDATLTSSAKTFTLTVNPALTTTQVIPARAGNVGTAIPSFIPVTAAGGTTPITFAISPLATLTGIGMAFNTATGAVSGTPTGTLAVTTFTVTATDNIGTTSNKTFTLTVNPVLSTTQAIPSRVGSAGTAIPLFIPVTAAGGTAPITFAITPAAALSGIGMAFNTTTGAVSGTPTGPLALTTFTVTATDAIGATSAQTFTLLVNPALTTTQAVPNTVGNQGTALVAFVPVTAAGGTAPVTFAVTPLATLTGIGLAFDVNTGTLSGTPTGPIVLTTFTVTATDAVGATSAKTFNLTVNGPLTTTQAIPARVGTQGAAIPAFIPVTAAGGTPPITFAITPLATLTGVGLAFNTTTGAVSGTPTGTLALTTFTVTATDNIGAISSKTFDLTINTALTTTLVIPARVGTQGTAIPSFVPVTAAGGTAPITFAVTPLATLTGIGMTFDVNTGAVAGTPTGALAATNFTVTATDAAGATSNKVFSLTVNGPVTTTLVIPARVGNDGTAIPSFIPVTAAGGTAPRTFAISPLATLTGLGLTFDVNTGAVAGTPNAPLTVTTFTVTATDAVGSSSSKNFTLTVNAALTTTQAIPARVGTQGTLIPSFVPVTAAGGTAPINFALTPLATLTGVGLTFNTTTGAVSGTPTGTLALTTFTVTATDNIGATSAKTFTLQINPALTTTQAIAARTGTQGSAITPFIPVTAAGGTAPITFAVSPLATLTGIGMAFDVNTGTVSGTPTGPLTVTTFTVTATDAIGATSAKTFTLTVNGPLTTTQVIPARVGTQGAAIPAFIPVTAAGGTPPVTFAISTPGALTGIGLVFNTTTGAVSGTPTGTLALTTFTVTATDNIGAISSKTFDLTINTALTTTLVIPARVGTQGTAIPSFVPVTAAGGTAPITFAVTPLATLTGIGMTFDVNTGAVAGTPTGALAATNFTVTATDAAGATSNKVFSLTVNGPVTTTLVIPARVGNDGTAIPSFIPVTAAGGTAPRTFAISPLATLTGLGLTFDVNTGAVAGTPNAPLTVTTFTVTATDAVGSSSSKNFTLTVNAALTTTQAIPARVGTQGTLIPSFVPVTAAGGTAPINFALTPLATLTGAGLSFNTTTGAVSGTPTNALGLTTFTVTATDGIGATSAKSFTLQVNPTLTTTQAVSATVGTQGTLVPTFVPVTAAGGTTPITFSVSSLATLTGIGMAFDVNTGAVSGTPTGPLALTNFTVTATDAAGATSAKTFSLLVNGPLTTTQAIAARAGTQGAAIPSFIPVTAAGGTGTIAFALSPLATLTGTGLAFNTATGAVSGTPAGTLGVTTFTVTATDGVGANSSKTFDLTINTALTTTQAVPATVGNAGTLIPTFTPVTAAGGTVPITFAVTPLATLTGIGMAFNVNTGAVSGTPAGPLALTTFTVVATDAAGATSNKTFTLTVNPALTTTQAVPVTTGVINTPLSFTPVTAAGGTPSRTFAVSSPATLTGIGLTFDVNTGLVSGTPNGTLATTTFTVTVTDAIGATSNKTFDLTVNSLPNSIAMLVGATPTASVASGNTVSIPLNIDMTNRGTDNLASVTVTISWDQAKFSLNSQSAGNWTDPVTSDPAFVVSNASPGQVSITGFVNNGSIASFTLRNIVLTAIAAGPTTGAVTATVTAAGNGGGQPVTVTPRNLSVTITP